MMIILTIEIESEPDFSTTGAYHIEGPFFTGNSSYIIRAHSLNKCPDPPKSNSR